jgi:hypothetical protein
MTTQGPLKALRRLAGPILAAGALVLAAPALAQQKATDWGWPQPYDEGLRQVGRLAQGEGLVAADGRLAAAVLGAEHRDGW